MPSLDLQGARRDDAVESAALASPERSSATERHVNRPDSCAHCGLPLPVGQPFGSFCCNGCRTVHDLLTAEGLERFYELGGGRGAPVGAAPKRGDRDWVVDLTDVADVIAAEADGPELVRCSVDVQGIHCAACVWVLQRVWERTPGAVQMRLNPSLGRADVVFDRRAGALDRYLDAVEPLGYRLGPAGKTERRDERGLLTRVGICVALALNAMMFALAGYLGMDEADGANHVLFQWLSFGLATAAVATGGPVFFRAAFAGLRHQVLHLDLPISLGIGLAWGASAFSFLLGGGEPYFDTVTIFVALMLVGRYLQRSAVRRNRDYLLAHDGAEHVRARRVRGDAVERVPVRDLEVGDELLLAPGDLVPVDARLIDGAASFSLDWISGESRPRRFAVGENVPAGGFVAERSPVRVRVARGAEASGLLQLLATPAPEDDDLRGRGRFWSLVNKSYVALVLVLAGLSGAIWAWIDPSRAVAVTTAVLVVTCPCALGLATPLAFDLAVARLRRAGIFVRNPNLLEKARHVRRVIFDKTGTLTWGGVRVRPLREVPERWIDALFTMATASNHPVSTAIAARLGAAGARWLDDLHAEERPGEGLAATYQGASLRLGSQAFTLGDRPLGDDHGICVFTVDGHPEATFEIEEDYRSGADVEVRALAADGIDLHLLSGDRPDRVVHAARRLGFPAEASHGGLSPEDKARIVRELDRGDTLMVGDGLNDAPAFEAAFCAGTPALDRPVMPARADFFYTGQGTGAVRDLLGSAARFRRVVVHNLVLAGAYNAIAVTLAALGWMTPLLCAVLMPVSSLVLIAHTTLALASRAAAAGPTAPVAPPVPVPVAVEVGS